MTKLSTKRFVAFASLVSLGWLMWATHSPRIGNLFLTPSILLLTPREHWQREIPWRDLQRLFLGVAAVIATFWGVVASGAITKSFIPPSFDRAMEQFFQNPAVIAVMWLLWLGAGFWQWRKGMPDRGT